MTGSFIHSAAVPLFLGAFEANPITGSLRVPVRMNLLTNAVDQKELTSETLLPFIHILGHAIRGVVSQFNAGLPTYPLTHGWVAFNGGARHLLLEHHRSGTALIFDRGGRLTRRLTGGDVGLAIGVRRYGAFASTEMVQAVDYRSPSLRFYQSYEIKFESCGVAALRTYLNLPEDLPIAETSFAFYRTIGADADPCVIEGLRERAPQEEHSPWESEISGSLEAGAVRFFLRAGLDAASFVQGEICETLALEVFPATPNKRSLPGRLLPLWNFAFEFAERYRDGESETTERTSAYLQLTHRIYGELPPLPEWEEIN